MLANTQTCAVVGLDGYVVQVEVDISAGLPTFKIEGTENRQVFVQFVASVAQSFV